MYVGKIKKYRGEEQKCNSRQLRVTHLPELLYPGRANFSYIFLQNAVTVNRHNKKGWLG